MNRKKSIRLLSILVLSVVMVSCGKKDNGPALTSSTVSGTASGIVGSVTLRMNGIEDLSIVSNGSFTFDKRLFTGTPYVVTQITSSGQACVLSNATGKMRSARVTDVVLACTPLSIQVLPLYPVNGAGWNAYVKDDGADRYTASDTVCDPAADTACLHGGEMRVVAVGGYSSCTGLTAADTRGVFDWTCDGSTSPVRMVSTGLKDGKGLADMVDFDVPQWQPDSVVVSNGSTTIMTTDNAPWWSNPVVEDNDGRELDVPGSIYAVTSSVMVSGGLAVTAPSVGLVIKPGAVLSGSGNALFSADSSNNGGTNLDFLWIEGALDQAQASFGVFWSSVRFSTVRNVTVTGDPGTSGTAVYLSQSKHDRVFRASATNSGNDGFRLSGDGNEYSWISAANCAGTGIDITGSGNSLSDSSATHCGYYGINLSNSSDDVLSRITATGNGTAESNANVGGGIYLDNASDNILENVTASGNIGKGLYVDTSGGNTFSHVAAGNNADYGVMVYSSEGNRFDDLTLENNGHSNTEGWDGIRLQASSRNRLSGITSANNGRNGVWISGASNDNTLVGVTAVNNGGYGLWIDESDGNVMLGVTGANNVEVGVLLEDAVHNSTFAAIAAPNNGLFGVSDQYNGTSGNNRFFGIAATDNQWQGVHLEEASTDVFSGPLLVGGNGDQDCSVTGGTDPGLVDGTCANQGASDAVLTTGVTVSTSFAGKVAVDDPSNSSDANGTASFDSILDWTNFADAYREWGKDGSAFPNADQEGFCASGETCRIWDWSLASGDSLLRNALALPTGNDVITHTWSDTSTTTFLKNAIEIIGDGVGNDNGLCESGEACLYMPNIGSYQGRGSLVSAGTITTGGAVQNVTLMKYQTNGY